MYMSPCPLPTLYAVDLVGTLELPNFPALININSRKQTPLHQWVGHLCWTLDSPGQQLHLMMWRRPLDLVTSDSAHPLLCHLLQLVTFDLSHALLGHHLQLVTFDLAHLLLGRLLQEVMLSK